MSGPLSGSVVAAPFGQVMPRRSSVRITRWWYTAREPRWPARRLLADEQGVGLAGCRRPRAPAPETPRSLRLQCACTKQAQMFRHVWASTSSSCATGELHATFALRGRDCGPTSTARGVHHESDTSVADRPYHVSAVVLGTAGTADASGTCTPQAKQVVFFYDISSGNGDSNNFSGYGSAALCADALGATSNNTFEASFVRNRTGLPDSTVQSFDRAYSQSQYTQGNFGTSSGDRFHTNAGWSYAGALPGSPNGFSRAVRPGTCTSP